MMTMRAPQGLEFEEVFLPGWEEVYFLVKNLLRGKRRLCFRGRKKVGLRWAHQSLKECTYISFATQSSWHGEWMDTLAIKIFE